FMQPVNRVYARGIQWALGRRAVIGMAVALMIGLAYLCYMHIGTGFLPEMDEGGLVIDYLTPPGTSLSETDSLVRQMESKVEGLPEKYAYSRRTGAELGLFATEQNKGDILVKLKPRSQRKRDIEEVITDLRHQVTNSIAGVDIEFIQILQDMLGDLEGSPEPVEVKIFGNDTEELNRVGDDLGDQIQKVPGIVDYKGPRRGNPELVVDVNPALAAHVGLTVAQVSDQLQAGLLGESTTDFRLSDRLIPIRVRYPDNFRGQENNIRQFPIL